jgi:hypothetical protein
VLLVAGVGAAVALVGAGALGAALLLDRHPGAAARLRALFARAEHQVADAVAGAGRPPSLACTPAVAVGAPGELRTLGALGPADRATALLRWAPGTAGAGAERQAVRAYAASRGIAVVPLGKRGAVAVTSDGPALRALAARAPRATPQLAAAGTRELCVLD